MQSLITCTETQHSNIHQSNLHGALAGAGRGGRRGSSGSLGKQGLAAKLVGTVLSSWTRLLNSHLCCSSCRSLFIWTEANRFPMHTPSSERALRCTKHPSSAASHNKTPLSPFNAIVRFIFALITRNTLSVVTQ